MAKNKIKIVLSCATVAGMLLVAASCGQKEDPTSGPDSGKYAVLHTLWDMNKEEAVLNSHSGEELQSTLQPIYECYQVIPHAKLIGSNPGENWACYPRIKRMADGRFIMLYHRSQYGAYIWYVTSDDLISWSSPKTLYSPYSVQVKYPDGTTKNDNRHFVNPDAVVLPNGDLLMVCSYRATGSYGDGLDCGLSFRLSKDNAKTWGQPLDVPVGPNWEPYMLVLPDGTIQCYYTDAIPQTRNSGTSMIVSKDSGQTWSPKQRVCQQYKYRYNTTSVEEKKQYNGQYIYTDQMPCFRVLNDGKTICGWLEARLESPTPSDCAVSSAYNSRCMMSLVRNHSLEWADLGSDGSYTTKKIEGPEDRESNVLKGAAGYVATFPSGEVVLSFGLNSLMSLKMGNASATEWRGGSTWTNSLILPFTGKGYWATTEAFNQNYLAVAMHSQESATNGMQVGAMYLNHRVDATASSVTLDGDASEWTNTRALYLSVPSKEDVIMRFSKDSKNFYIAVECRDSELSAQTEVDIVLAHEGKSGNIKLKKEGLISSSLGAKAVTKEARSSSDTKGWVSEVSIGLDALGISKDGTVLCYAELIANGNKAAFTLSDSKDKNTWQRIIIH